ncbi:hypothetical protein [Serratia proteamaculans]|uniref:hypothetical protein n=1 Tax=Serratia proteamaculans TaxID=28151 RepID=UPI0021B7244A|nr:hypothetical protein [Serratia proteamaculans]
MKMFLLTAVLPLVAIAGCSEKQQESFNPYQNETPECRSYRVMTGAPMLPDAYARLRDKCEASMKK